MYYYWGQLPYTVAPYFRSNETVSSISFRDVEDLKQRVQQLYNQFQEISDKISQWETHSDSGAVRSQGIAESRGLELLRGVEQQINSLRAEQMTAYEQLFNRFLTARVSNHIRELQKDITPGMIMEKISSELESNELKIPQVN